MARTPRRTPKVGTYFEQVPLDRAKKAARTGGPKPGRRDNVVVAPKTEPYSVPITRITH